MENNNLMTRIPSIFFKSSKLFFYLNAAVFILLPLFTIVRNRFIEIPILYYNIFALLIYCFVFIQNRELLPLDKSSKMSSNIKYYIVFPMAAPFLIAIFIKYFSKLFSTGENPQNLTQYTTFEKFAASLFSALIAGAEEIWRYSTILVISMLLHKLVCKIINKNKIIYQNIILAIALLISSLIFGWLHTFSYSEGWFDFDIYNSIVGIWILSWTHIVID
ncbi:hypothetical protein [Paenibacillus pini]|uniref:Uncharacterized protein n=1 Tax=Paenibacillus pini JCM 16418 TaxID=1236976 RepID=W7Z1L5_9BACL|nr:hypothetical protein [Paenibacillus pini]GAF10876.1 hypothetical protein JCM16418_5106 [Paenibacillus pini JCM 16418]